MGGIDCSKCGQPLPEGAGGEAPRCPACSATSTGFSRDQTVTILPDDGALPPAPRGPDAPAIRTFGRYQILDELGRGGYGVVYKAHDPELRRTVALKVLLAAEHASAEEVERFAREASSAAMLQHPNIVPIFEFRSLEGRHYYTMAFLAAAPLDEYVRAGNLSVHRKLAIVEKVALALNHAHSQGVVHRDLKPGNILVTADGEPRVTDFGLAKIMGAEQVPSASRLSRSGVAMGTPQYMSPEQACGEHRSIDGRSDIYSLGCILYEVLTGGPPFDDQNAMEVMRRQVDDDPVPPSARGVRLSPDVETVCLKCLEKDPARRYRTAGELAADIRRFLDGEPIAARRASLVYVARRKLMRHKAVAAVAAAAFALVAGLSAWYILSLRKSHRAIERELYASNVGLAYQHVLRGNVARADELLAGCPGHLRGWEWGFVKAAAHQEQGLLAGHSAPVVAVAWSPDGARLAAASADRTVSIWDALNRSLLATLEPGAPGFAAAWSPDGRLLATGHADGLICLWDPGGAKFRSVRGHGTSPVHALAFGPGSRLLASGALDGTLKVWNPADLTELASADAHKSTVEIGVGAVAFSPDGETLASIGGEGAVKLWTPSPLTPLRTIPAHAAPASTLAFSRDGRLLASGGNDDLARIWDPGSGRCLVTLTGHLSAVLGLAFSPDGSVLATGSYDRTVRLWEAAGGRRLAMLTGHTGIVRSVSYSPDGQSLVSGSDDRTARVWDTGRERNCVTVRNLPGMIRTVVFSPDSSSVATGQSDGSVQVHDAATGELILGLKPHALSVRGLAFTPDGRNLVSAGSDRTVKLLDLAAGGRERTLAAGATGVQALAMSPDGRTLYVGDRAGGIVRHALAGNAPVRPLTSGGRPVACLALSADGRRLASADGETGEVRLWETATGRELLAFRTDETDVYTLSFSPDGTLLATAGHHGETFLWDARTGRRAAVLSGHLGQVRSAAFSPDGLRLATGCMDHVVKIWDPLRGRELLTLEGHTAKLYTVAFSPDGRRLASGGRDNCLRIWRAADWRSGPAQR